MAIITHRRIGDRILSLVRTRPHRSGVRGLLYLPNGAALHTLEDRPIAPGAYFLNPDDTGKHQNWIIESELGSRSAGGGRVDVEIHAGNTLRDSEGCILLGVDSTLEGVMDSRTAVAFARNILDRDDDDPRVWFLNISQAF